MESENWVGFFFFTYILLWHQILNWFSNANRIMALYSTHIHTKQLLNMLSNLNEIWRKARVLEDFTFLLFFFFFTPWQRKQADRQKKTLIKWAHPWLDFRSDHQKAQNTKKPDSPTVFMGNILYKKVSVLEGLWQFEIIGTSNGGKVLTTFTNMYFVSFVEPQIPIGLSIPR